MTNPNVPSTPEQNNTTPPVPDTTPEQSVDFDAELQRIHDESKTIQDSILALDNKQLTIADIPALQNNVNLTLNIQATIQTLMPLAIDDAQKSILEGYLNVASNQLDHVMAQIEEVKQADQATGEQNAEANLNNETGGNGSPENGANRPGATIPMKKVSERIAEGVGSAFKTVSEFASSLGNKIGKALDDMGVNIEGLMKFAEILGADWLVNMLKPRVEVAKVRKKILANFTKEQYVTSDNDKADAAALREQYNKKILDSEGKLTEASFSFDTFLQEKIDLVKADTPEKVSIADLLNAKTNEEKRAETEKNDEHIDALKLANFKYDEAADVWELKAQDLGETADATPKAINAVYVKKINGAWKWKTNADGTADYHGKKLDEAQTGLSAIALKARQDMNSLRTKLEIQEPAAPTNPNTPDENAAENRKVLREKMNENAAVKENAYLLALASVAKTMGMTTDVGNLEQDSVALSKQTTVNQQLKDALKSFFAYHSTIDSNSSQEALGIYINGNVLKEGHIDNDEFDNDIMRGVNLDSPVRFLDRLMQFEIADTNESKETGYDLNARALEKLPKFRDALKAKTEALWGA